MTKKARQKLRWGFTTGTAAAAATKAALILLVTGKTPEHVDVTLLTGDAMRIAVHVCRRCGPGAAEASVIKDAGDDPDITHGAEIGARVTWAPGSPSGAVEILGGPGVGRVTKPGLEVPPGKAAINPGPQQMIRRAVAEVMETQRVRGQVTTEIFVPKGVELARHTLNERLGILGGISILGTTGIVKPLSHAAYIATIQAALSVARSAGLQCVVLSTGRRSERLAQNLWPEISGEGFVQIGDYFEKSMAMTAELGFREARLCVFFGKALKMAQRNAHTHARSAQLTLKPLAQWTMEATGNSALAQRVAEANTARHAFDMIHANHPDLIRRVGREMVAAATIFGKKQVNVRGIILGFGGSIVFDSESRTELESR